MSWWQRFWRRRYLRRVLNGCKVVAFTPRDSRGEHEVLGVDVYISKILLDDAVAAHNGAVATLIANDVQQTVYEVVRKRIDDGA